ncbi:bifunctional hydroxymethylpyrimidine kinase/phosphomethylpyrimidine kinase [Metabacillus sp. GX 13764]|uniref:bifunctional hydroxymethylpyrimidine kinase/phosphomethylpyrimidine kinase n=1 Tax=Metabacillus kandeliae TaxID=2900151 RepID=UPI001E5A6783|nr:bifunctional hydroxymethylpyrimidine kinase/phosphomethylpyrimidine kinase [Metabacillus kandeliae]MCD7035052.1 bifunctional hydroxymethylpyrimidine kinase/phosphomethylpyrimidine kinase [Metabacillus kandeliae]
MKIAKALTIAGSDSGGGAGIQADLKTFQELKVYGMSAVTAVTAQNTTGVQGVYPMAGEAVSQQLQSIEEDLPPDAVKTGMLFNTEIISAAAFLIKEYKWDNLVIDPVMIAKGGSPLLQKEAMDVLKKELLPLAKVITPNIPEAEEMIGGKISSSKDKEAACRLLHEMGPHYVIIKGGHDDHEESCDLLYDGMDFAYFSEKRIPTKHTHGTGCTFSAAITAELAKGINIREAVRTAKQYIQAAILHTLKIGSGHGPTNHWAYQQLKREEALK